MAVTLRSSGTFSSAAIALAVEIPSTAQTGDLLLLLVETANQTVTAPSGWSSVTNSPQGTGTAGAAGGVRLSVFYRLMDGTEGDTVTVADSGDHQAARVAAFYGVDQTIPIDVTAGSVLATGATAITCPAVTTTVDNCYVLNIVASDRDGTSGTFSAWTNANLSSLVEFSDAGTTLNTGGVLGAAGGLKATAGSTGTTAVTQATAVTAAMLTIALTPDISAVRAYTHQLVTEVISLPDSPAAVTYQLALEVLSQVVTGQILAPSTGSLSVIGKYPTLSMLLAPSVGAVVLTGAAPSLTSTQTIELSPSVGAVLAVGNSPSTSEILVPATGAVIAGGNAPSRSLALQAVSGQLTFEGKLPILSYANILQVSSGSLLVEGKVSTASFGKLPTAGFCILAGNAPSLARTLQVSAGSVVVSGNNSGITHGIPGSTGNCDIAGNPPSVAHGIGPAPGSVVLTGNACSLLQTLQCLPGSLIITGYVPYIEAGNGLNPFTGSIQLTGNAPTKGLTVAPLTGIIKLTGRRPAFPGTGTVITTRTLMGVGR